MNSPSSKMTELELRVGKMTVKDLQAALKVRGIPPSRHRSTQLKALLLDALLKEEKEEAASRATTLETTGIFLNMNLVEAVDDDETTMQIHQQQQQQSDYVHEYYSLYPVLSDYDTVVSVLSESTNGKENNSTHSSTVIHNNAYPGTVGRKATTPTTTSNTTHQRGASSSYCMVAKDMNNEITLPASEDCGGSDNKSSDPGATLGRKQQSNNIGNANLGGHGEDSGVGVRPQPITNPMNDLMGGNTVAMNKKRAAHSIHSSPRNNAVPHSSRGSKSLHRLEVQHDRECTGEECSKPNCHARQAYAKSIAQTSGSGSGSGSNSGSSGLNGSWHADTDLPKREQIVRHIMKILRETNNISPQSLSKLPQLALNLEKILYRNASSLGAYVELSTLTQRLVEIQENAPIRQQAQIRQAQIQQQQARRRSSQSGANHNFVTDSSIGVTSPPLSHGMDGNNLSQRFQRLDLSSHGMYGVNQHLNSQHDQYVPDSGGQPPSGGGGQVPGGHSPVRHSHSQKLQPQPQQPFGYQAYGEYQQQQQHGQQQQQQHGQRLYNPDAHQQIVVEWNISGVSLDKLRHKIQQIIEEGDKKTATVTSVRTTLEEWLDMDLTEHKNTIRTLAMEFL